MIYLAIGLGLLSAFLMYRLFVITNAYVRLYNEAVELLDQKNSDADKEIKESFLKFISDSREWAFDYIEKTQDSLKEIVSEMGTVLGKDNLDGNDVEELSNIYARLKNMLPEE